MRSGPEGRPSPLLRVLATALALLAISAHALATGPPAAAQVAQAFVDDDDLGWGDTTTLRGSGWAPGSTVHAVLHAGNHELATPVAEPDGTITAQIRIPHGLGSSADYVIAVQGTALDGTIVSVAVPVTIRGPEPTFSADPSEVRWGDSTTASGTQWEPGTTVDITLMPVTQVLARATVRSDGTFSVAVAIPADLPSSRHYQLVATGQGINKLFSYVPSGRITIIGPSAAMSVRDTVLAWGQTTTLVGDRFKPGTTAQVHLLPNSILLTEVTVPEGGRFEASVTIPEDLPASRGYQLVATGTGIDSLFAFVPQAVTITGPDAFIEVTDVSGPGGRAVQVDGHRFLRRTSTALTLLPGYEDLGRADVGPDGTFSIRVPIPDAVAAADRHVLVATGQGADGRFAYVAREITLGADGAIAVGSSVLPPGGLRDAVARPPARDLDRVEDGLRMTPVAPDDESADELGLALLLLLLFLLVGWFLRYSLRHDIGAAVRRRLPQRRAKQGA